jgi:hypothetical protein
MIWGDKMSEANSNIPFANGKPAPAYYNDSTEQYEYLKGVNGGPYYTHRGTVAQEAWEGNATITKTFTENRYGFSIMNDGAADLTFTINSQTRTVKPGEAYSALFDPFTTVTITTTSAYRAEVLK